MIGDILPTLIFTRGKRARPEPNIVRAAPVSLIVPRAETRAGVIGYLVVLVAGSSEHGYRDFEQSHFGFVLWVKLATLKARQKLRVFFVS